MMKVTASGVLSELPPMKGDEVKLVDQQDVFDIIKAVLAKHRETVKSYDDIADRFYDPDVFKMCQQLYAFCQKEVPYHIESEDRQTVRTPAAVLALGSVMGGDCKHYAGFIAGVLDAVSRKYGKIDWCYRFVSYDLFKRAPGHVFVVVDPGTEDEIWIDPVLPVFDSRTPWPIWTTDKKVNMALYSISGVGDYEYLDYEMDTMGAATGTEVTTTGKIGSGLLAVAPALAAVPVVGWIAGPAAGIVGGLLKVFGGRREAESSSVRDLIKHFRIRVKGFPTSDKGQNVSVAEADEGQAWFSVVVGVPIYDTAEFLELLKGPAAYRAYRRLGGRDLEDISDANILQGQYIAKSMNIYAPMKSGEWAWMVAARVQTDTPVNAQTLQGGGVINPSSLNDTSMNTALPATTTSVDPNQTAGGLLKNNPLLTLGLVGVAAFGLYQVSKPKKRVGKTDSNTILLVGGLGIAGVLVYTLMKRSSAPVTQYPVYQQQPVYQAGYQQPQQSGSNVWDFLDGALTTAGSLFGKSSGTSNNANYYV